MFGIGELIIYGSMGVCRVLDVGPLKMSGVNQERTYYTLSPLYQDGVIYAPVDTNVFMRPIITFEEAQQLIREIPQIGSKPCPEDGLRMLDAHYKETMQSHACKDLVQLIKTVYEKEQRVVKQGKKLGQIDERYKKQAEEILHGELAMALKIAKEDVHEYIRSIVE